MTEINEMFAKTNIEEMKALFGFLHALHEALWEAFNNGRKPDVKPYKYCRVIPFRGTSLLVPPASGFFARAMPCSA